MIKTYLQLIFYTGIILLQPLVWGDDTYGTKPDTASFSTGSCADRCHVNYMAYQTVYQGEIFRHKTHSPNQGLECSQCHNNDAVHTKTHGRLIIQNKDCWVCHHKRMDTLIVNSLPSESNENIYNSSIPLSSPLLRGDLEGFKRGKKSPDEGDCLKCHADVRDYINGSMQNMVPKLPDWMSETVLCVDCHKPALDGFSFKAVREYCVECHNNDYGLLYDAWKKTLDSKIKQLYENDRNTIPMQNLLKLVQSYGMHNIRLSQKFLQLISHD